MPTQTVDDSTSTTSTRLRRHRPLHGRSSVRRRQFHRLRESSTTSTRIRISTISTSSHRLRLRDILRMGTLLLLLLLLLHLLLLLLLLRRLHHRDLCTKAEA